MRSRIRAARAFAIVSEMLGHSSIGIGLDTYCHGIPGLGEAAAEAMEDALS